jgi:uncharacterized protein
MRSGRLLRRILAVTAGLAVLSCGAAWLAGSLLLAPNQRTTIPPAGRGMESVRLAASDGVPLRGWWWPGEDPGRAVLLLHGLHADRLQMFPRARWLHSLGYSVLFFDFRGCGESGGTVTFGFREGLDVEAALRFLERDRKVGRVMILGQSMGAAAALEAVDAWGAGVTGAVLESPYDRFGDAVRLRVRRFAGALEPLLSPLLLVQVPWRLGFRPEDLAPVESIRRARCPILLGFGGRDPYASGSLEGDFFRNAPSPVTLWVIRKARHDLYRFDPESYRKKIGEFITENLGPPRKEGKG